MRSIAEIIRPIKHDGFLLSDFHMGYIKCALWIGDGENSIDNSPLWDVDNLHPDTLLAMIADCDRFFADNSHLWHPEDELGAVDYDCIPDPDLDSRAGHDFYLSRNGHGSGFFDGEEFYGDSCDELQEIARSYGTVDLYIGDDGLIYQF